MPSRSGCPGKDHEYQMFNSLQESQDILLNAPIGIFTSTPEGRFLAVNPAMAKLYGFNDPEEMIQTITDIDSQFYLHSEGRREFQRRLERDGQIINYEYQVRRKDGSIIWVSTNARAVQNNVGRIIQYQGYSTDITERKQIEKIQQQSENYYRAMFETTETIMLIVEENTSVLQVNSNFEKILGYSRQEVEGIKSWTEFVHPEDVNWMREYHYLRRQNPKAAPRQYECRLITRQGQKRHILLSIDLIPGTTRSIASGVDITQRKHDEEELRKSRLLLQDMERITKVGGWEYDVATARITWTDEVYRIYGVSPLSYDPGSIFQDINFYPPEDQTILAEAFQKAIEEGKSYDLELRFINAQGKPLWVRTIGQADWQAGKVVRVYGNIMDITKRKRAEEALSHSHELMRYIVEHANSAVAVHDKDCRYMYVSQSYLEQFNIQDKDIIGRHHYEVFPDLPQKWRDVHQRALKGEVSRAERDPFYDQDGRMQWTRWECRPWYEADNSIGGFIVYTEVITDRVREEKKKTEQKALLEAIFVNVPLVLMLVDKERRVQQINGFATQFAKRPAEEMLGLRGGEALRCLHALEHPEGCGFGGHCQHCVIRKTVLNTLEQGTTHLQVEAQYTFYLDGQSRNLTLLVSSTPVTYHNFRMALVTLQDISKRKQFEEQLKYLSLHDQLTGLHNRAYLENELQRLQNSRDFPVTIVCIDLDGLKLINDTLGHDHGDWYLKACARILQESFRGSDIVARVGGDEFTALLPRTDIKSGEKIVNRIQARLESYNQEQMEKIPLSLSIGLACAADSSKELIQVYKNADDLMYRDKLHRNTTSRSQIMRALMAALEERDFITSGHAKRLEELCLKLGRQVGLVADQLANLNLLAQVHDLGKVGIPDHILFKPGPLTAEEWQIMRQHPEKGYRIAQATTDLAGIAELILKHHERWDGKGYPLGLKAEDIPIECRILAIADTFDAMTNDRPYRGAISDTQALEELKKYAGSQFDPYLVEIFLGRMSEE